MKIILTFLFLKKLEINVLELGAIGKIIREFSKKFPKKIQKCKMLNVFENILAAEFYVVN